MNLSFRPAEISDLIPLRSLSIESFSLAYARFNTQENMRNYLSENFSEEKLLSEINEGQILLSVQKDKVVAYAKLVAPYTDKIPKHHPLEISRLYTDTTLIGQGIGKQMLAAIADEAQKRNCDSICLDVWQKNHRAINFYQREGFKI